MAENNASDKPKIIVDDDWKTQAQEEKRRLAEEARKSSGASGRGGERDIPPADFISLVNAVALQAMFALGGVEDPETKKRYVDLEAAKYHIDTLGMLEEKTKGNLTAEESDFLSRALYDLRTGFVEISRHVQVAPPPKPPK